MICHVPLKPFPNVVEKLSEGSLDILSGRKMLRNLVAYILYPELASNGPSRIFPPR